MKWEYYTFSTTGSSMDRLNQLGEEGWELVAVTLNGRYLHHTLKRPLDV